MKKLFPNSFLLIILLISLFTFLESSTTFAEYRAFLLEMKSPTSTEVTKIKSNLDPEQYRYYYNVSPDIKISYTDTWMCPPKNSDASIYRRTVAFEPVCPNPKDLNTANPSNSPPQSPERQPANK
jgi:hypothetical protein